MIKKLKKGDNVIVLLGKDRGKSGTVERVLIKDKKVLIPSINLYKRSVSARAARSQGLNKGEIIEIAKPIDISNVALVCPSCKKPTRVGFKMEDDKKIRLCRKCGKEIK